VVRSCRAGPRSGKEPLPAGHDRVWWTGTGRQERKGSQPDPAPIRVKSQATTRRIVVLVVVWFVVGIVVGMLPPTAPMDELLDERLSHGRPAVIAAIDLARWELSLLLAFQR
jgi:hypothetical protein